jgi:hypothetical protein
MTDSREETDVGGLGAEVSGALGAQIPTKVPEHQKMSNSHQTKNDNQLI